MEKGLKREVFLGRSFYDFVVKTSRVRSALGGFSSSVLLSEKLDLKFILGKLPKTNTF